MSWKVNCGKCNNYFYVSNKEEGTYVKCFSCQSQIYIPNRTKVKMCVKFSFWGIGILVFFNTFNFMLAIISGGAASVFAWYLANKIFNKK